LVICKSAAQRFNCDSLTTADNVRDIEYKIGIKIAPPINKTPPNLCGTERKIA